MYNANLGEFEQIVLLAVARCDDDAYGITIRDEIRQRIGREVSIGALYVTLDRLTGKGYLRNWLGKATKVRGGRAKKHFALTARGGEALETSRDQQRRMWAGLDMGRVVKRS